MFNHIAMWAIIGGAIAIAIVVVVGFYRNWKLDHPTKK